LVFDQGTHVLASFALFVCADADKVDAVTACNLTNNVTYEDPSMIPLGIKIEKWGQMMRAQGSRRQLVVMPGHRFHQRIMRLMTTISETDFGLFIEEPGNAFRCSTDEYDDVLVCDGVSAELRTEVEAAGKRVWEEGKDQPQPKGCTPHDGDIVLGGVRVPNAVITLDAKQRTISVTSMIDEDAERPVLKELLRCSEQATFQLAIHPHFPLSVSSVSSVYSRSSRQPKMAYLTIIVRQTDVAGIGNAQWDEFVWFVGLRERAAKSPRPTTHLADVDIREGEFVVRGSDGSVLPLTKQINKSERLTDDLTRAVAEMVWDEGGLPTHPEETLSLANRIIDVVSAENAKAKELAEQMDTSGGSKSAEQVGKEQADAGRLDELKGLLEKLNTSVANVAKKMLNVDASITPMCEALKDLFEGQLPRLEATDEIINEAIRFVHAEQTVMPLSGTFNVARIRDALSRMADNRSYWEEAAIAYVAGALRRSRASINHANEGKGEEGGGTSRGHGDGGEVGAIVTALELDRLDHRLNDQINRSTKSHSPPLPTSRPLDAASSAPPILPALHHVHDIEYFDGPILSEYRSGSGNVYVEKWCTTLEKEGAIRGQRFLVVRVNANRIADYISKRITMLELLVGASDDVGFLVDRVNGVKNGPVIDQIVMMESVQFVRVSTLPSSYLPRPDARHDDSLRPDGVLGAP
jgi:hypothetical protein